MTIDEPDKPFKVSFHTNRTGDGEWLIRARFKCRRGTGLEGGIRLSEQGKRVLLEGIARAGLLGHFDGAKKIRLRLDTGDGMRVFNLKDLLADPDGKH